MMTSSVFLQRTPKEFSTSRLSVGENGLDVLVVTFLFALFVSFTTTCKTQCCHLAVRGSHGQAGNLVQDPHKCWASAQRHVLLLAVGSIGRWTRGWRPHKLVSGTAGVCFGAHTPAADDMENN
mgnify:CR=1 FL=1